MEEHELTIRKFSYIWKILSRAIGHVF